MCGLAETATGALVKGWSDRLLGSDRSGGFSEVCVDRAYSSSPDGAGRSVARSIIDGECRYASPGRESRRTGLCWESVLDEIGPDPGALVKLAPLGEAPPYSVIASTWGQRGMERKSKQRCRGQVRGRPDQVRTHGAEIVTSISSRRGVRNASSVSFGDLPLLQDRQLRRKAIVKAGYLDCEVSKLPNASFTRPAREKSEQA